MSLPLKPYPTGVLEFLTTRLGGRDMGVPTLHRLARVGTLRVVMN